MVSRVTYWGVDVQYKNSPSFHQSFVCRLDHLSGNECDSVRLENVLINKHRYVIVLRKCYPKKKKVLSKSWKFSKQSKTSQYCHEFLVHGFFVNLLILYSLPGTLKVQLHEIF